MIVTLIPCSRINRVSRHAVWRVLSAFPRMAWCTVPAAWWLTKLSMQRHFGSVLWLQLQGFQVERKPAAGGPTGYVSFEAPYKIRCALLLLPQEISYIHPSKCVLARDCSEQGKACIQSTRTGVQDSRRAKNHAVDGGRPSAAYSFGCTIAARSLQNRSACMH